MKRSGETTWELTTWFGIICATLATIYFSPWYVAEDILRYILMLAGIAAAFWYIRSRRLLADSRRKTKELEIQQREIENRQKTIDLIFENSADGILMLDGEQKIISFSPGLERISGFSKAEAVNKSAKDLLKFKGDSDNSLLPDMMFLSDNLKRRPYIQNTIITKEGREIDVEASCALIHETGKNRSIALAIIRDVTYEKELKQRDKEFIAITSHQLNTPLSIIQGYLSLLKKEKLTGKQVEYIDEVVGATSKMISLTSNLLSISRIEQDKIKLEKADTNVADLVSKIEQNYKSAAEKKGLKLVVRPIKPDLIMYADADKISQAISNMVSNAVKYTKTGSIEIGAEIKAGIAEFSVADTGIGILPEDIARVGEKFYRSQSAIDVDNQGTGLGLFITKTIVEKHGGKLEIESAPGKGSTFSFKLPVK